MDGICWAFINRAGTAARVCGRNTTDSTLDTYSSGADITTGYTLDFGYSYTANPQAGTNRVMVQDCSDDFATMAVIIQGQGLWVTFNGGSTWAENKVPVTGIIPLSVAVDDLDNVWVLRGEATSTTTTIGSNALLRTTDGTLFTEIVTTHDILAASNGDFDQLSFIGVFTGAANEVFLLASGTIGVGSTNGVMMNQLVMGYSEDSGATWTANVIANNVMTYSFAEFWNFVQDQSNGLSFGLSHSGSVLAIGNAAEVRLLDLTTGLVLPIIPQHKIVAEAP